MCFSYLILLLGGSGVDFAKGTFSLIHPYAFGGLAVREAYDFISWDPRGVKESSGINCGFKSAESYMSFAAKHGLKNPNATARMIAGMSYPMNKAEVRIMTKLLLCAHRGVVVLDR